MSLRNPMQHDLVTKPFGHIDGWVYPPTGPGLGIEVIDEVVTSNPKQAESYAAGKDGLFGFFVGQVMKATSGRANPVITSDLLHKRLGR